MKNVISKLIVAVMVLTLFACGQKYQQKMDTLTENERKLADGVLVDTVVVFDPATGEETIKLVERKIDTKDKVDRLGMSEEIEKTGIDTIVTFDPKTYKETITIINHDTGEKIVKKGQD